MNRTSGANLHIFLCMTGNGGTNVFCPQGGNIRQAQGFKSKALITTGLWVVLQNRFLFTGARKETMTDTWIATKDLTTETIAVENVSLIFDYDQEKDQTLIVFEQHNKTIKIAVPFPTFLEMINYIKEVKANVSDTKQKEQ